MTPSVPDWVPTLDRGGSHPEPAPAHAGSFQRVHHEIRRVRLRRFPYAIYFRVSGDEVVVLAVMHGRRHPRRWSSRR
jgi:plasmid stabilization system protein ParE